MRTNRNLPLPHIRRKIAGDGEVALITVEKYFKDSPIQPLSRKRIEDALRKLGMVELIRPEPPREG